MIDSKNFDFSFSGLKTAVLYTVQKLLKNNKLSDIQPAIANEFQNAAIDVLVKKTIDAAKKYKAKTIALSGGVAANKALREKLKKNSGIFHYARNQTMRRQCLNDSHCRILKIKK